MLERITLGSPLSGQPLDARRYGFLQTRIGRDDRLDLFTWDIKAGGEDFWQRFQRPFATSPETMHLDDQVIKSVVEELMAFNGWAAAACSSLIRPFGVNRVDDAYTDLTRAGQLYYFALVVHSADHFLIDQLAAVVQLGRRLGTSNIFVSLVDYASSDSTSFLCDLMEAVMRLLGISFRIRRVDPMTKDPAASYYPLEEAMTRNLALEPLVELHRRRKVRFAKVIWLKGFACPTDILETLRVSAVNEAAMTCSMDWKEHNGFFIYNDRCVIAVFCSIICIISHAPNLDLAGARATSLVTYSVVPNRPRLWTRRRLVTLKLPLDTRCICHSKSFVANRGSILLIPLNPITLGSPTGLPSIGVSLTSLPLAMVVRHVGLKGRAWIVRKCTFVVICGSWRPAKEYEGKSVEPKPESAVVRNSI